MFKKFKVLAPLFTVLALTGCGGDQARPTAKQEPATPRRGGTAVTGWIAEPGGVNELIVPSSQVTNEVLFRTFDRLLEEQPDFEEHPPTFAPQLARSYEWSDGHKTLTFHLRDDAVWSDGVPVTAEDVRWTWQAQTNPDIAWDSIDSKGWITDVEVVDPHTVRMHFSRVYAGQILDANEGVILPKHAWEKIPFAQWRKSGEWFKAHAVVSGPFVYGSWQPGQQLVLQRNGRYRDKEFPYLDRVILRFTPDQASLLTQILNGELDFVPQVSPGDAPRVKANPRLELIPYWFNLYVGVAWNNENPLFSDPEVRRALTLGIDRQTIVETILGEYGRIATTPILTSVWAHDKSIRPWPYDPVEARRILAAKGWKDTDGDGVLDRGGKPFTFELLTNAGNQARADATVMIQDQLKKVGVRVQPRLVEFNTLMAQTVEGTYAACMLGESLDTSLDMTDNYHSRSIKAGGNFTRYKNPEMDRLLETAASQPNMLAMRPYLERIQRILHRDQPMTFLWESKRLTAVNKRLRDVRPTMLWSFFNLKEWWIRPQG
ncbi:MAG TPA: ABC transporter substrate-binding protein [Thermoanaerobaculia bacterium]|jgi:peptide/nickel transport system substrate-binding protein|nr:ABC transporter substrate-binding protein [Thermoanaerobaculia bacterium]